MSTETIIGLSTPLIEAMSLAIDRIYQLPCFNLLSSSIKHIDIYSNRSDKRAMAPMELLGLLMQERAHAASCSHPFLHIK